MITTRLPLFSAVICGCNAGLFRDALHEVYIPRIQRGNAYFAPNVLGVRGPLLAVLAHFFEQRRWGSTVEIGVEGQSLRVEDQLFILMQAALYLRSREDIKHRRYCICYQRAERFCHSLNRPMLLYAALIGQWRYSLVTEKLTATMQIAKRVYSLAHEQNNPALLLKACMALAATLYYLGDFEASRQYAICGVQLWRSGGVQSQVEEVDPPVIGCLCHKALIEWHFGFEGRWWCAELHRLRGVFLTALGAAETQIEASFCAAISTARKAEVDFSRETRPSNLRRIPSPKSERVGRT